MDRRDEIASLLAPDEVRPALEFVSLMETSGQMRPDEAHDWRMRIAAWARYKAMPATDPPRG
jgi:hypothetical protein